MATPVTIGANFDTGSPVVLFQANPCEMVDTSVDCQPDQIDRSRTPKQKYSTSEIMPKQLRTWATSAFSRLVNLNTQYIRLYYC
jgi:hypothetical protein